MVKKQCNHAGCKVLIPYNQTYCEKHTRKPKQSDADRYEYRKAKGGKYFKFYHSKEYEKENEKMDKVYIDKKTKTVGVELPKYGEIILIVKDGQVVRYETKTTNKLE